MTLLSVRDLSVVFRPSSKITTEAVKSVSFTINPQETLALVGESGSGKSVSALSILKLLPSKIASHPTGSILFQTEAGEKELLTCSESEIQRIRGNDIAMIFQEPMMALNPLHTLEKQIAEPLLIHKKLSVKQAHERVKELLALVGFAKGQDRLRAYPHQLSGGERQRVMIAMALANEPKLLIADEPTTALDVTIQAGILKLIQELQSQFKMALLLISHDLNLVAKMAESVCVMRQGEIVESGKTAEVLHSPRHPYTRHLLESEPKGEAIPLSPRALPILEVQDLNITFSKLSSSWDMYLGKKVGGTLKKWLKHIWSFPTEMPAVNAVQEATFTLHQGETLGIVGESGSGKSSLAYGILQLLPYGGEVLFHQQSLRNLSPRERRTLRQRIQIIFQDPFGSLNPRLSIKDIIAEGLNVHHPELSEQEKTEKVETILQEVGLDPLMLNRYPHEFSGGQRQRIAIARALVLRPEIVVLDEPTSALDRSIQMEVLELLKTLQKRYKLSYIFISHDLKVVRSISHRVLVMRSGEIVEAGNTADLFQNPQKPYTKALLKAALEVIV